MRQLTIIALLLLLTVSGTVATPIGSASVPVGDPVYSFLERCEARGIIPLWSTTAQPLSRLKISSLLMQAVAFYPKIYDRRLRTDLDYYIREFAWDISRLSQSDDQPRRTARSVQYSPSDALQNPHWHLVQYRSDDFHFVLDPLIWARYDIGKDQKIFRRATGLQFRGDFNGWLGYYFRFIDHTERGNGPYTDRSQLLHDRYGYVGPLQGNDETYYDLTEAYLHIGWKKVDLMFGKDRVAWGPSRNGGLLLSGYSPSFNQLRLTARLTKKVRFNYVVGRLNTGMPGDTLYHTDRGWIRTELTPKWLAAHRLEYSPWKSVVFGISEAIIWGERGLDPAYLNPIYFFYSAEHDGGDQDNILMSGDVLIRIARGGILYGELLIDDVKTSTLGEGDPGNRLGVTAGGWLTHIGINGLETGIEYTRLEPFVYSHFFPVNRYSTWTSSLGSELSPNSDRLRLRLCYRPELNHPAFKRTEFNGRIDWNRHGSVGGDISETIPPLMTQKVHFLDGDRIEWTSVAVSVRFEPIPGLFLETGWINNDQPSVTDHPALLSNIVYLTAGYRYSD
ncbi:MAG: capsule assembly Wzi family protein [Candidatus Electryoneaceae bacterium]|nr:capsule assembly Wzi family protein [Candidatus Electryoneaceae bacterium]